LDIILKILYNFDEKGTCAIIEKKIKEGKILSFPVPVLLGLVIPIIMMFLYLVGIIVIVSGCNYINLIGDIFSHQPYPPK
jgi:hypothetical protein